jgi:2-isopropylmalate synthase
VVYDAEHFFDGYRADAGYAVETLRAAIRGGAETVVLCDTNGGNLPWLVEEVVRDVVGKVQHRVGIHAHDDTGCGVANSVAAVRGGAAHVQGTVNGYGERCGNANLCVIVPNLELKLDKRCLKPGKLGELSELSRFVAEVANLAPDSHMAYVGKSAFAHKGGVHVAAMRRNGDSYQHIDPALVGNEMRVVVSELSGRGNLLHKAEELGLEVSAGAEVEALQEIKEAEARGMSYDSAEASVALLLLRKAKDYQPLFEVIEYQVQVGRRKNSETIAEAVVKLRVGSDLLHTAAEGTGPVGALDTALRKALSPVYPALGRIHLADYKVRILDGKEGTEATTRVLIDSRDEEHKTWSTVGASPNIIEASLHALVDAIEYGLIQAGAKLSEADVARSNERVSDRPPPPPKPTRGAAA